MKLLTSAKTIASNSHSHKISTKILKLLSLFFSHKKKRILSPDQDACTRCGWTDATPRSSTEPHCQRTVRLDSTRWRSRSLLPSVGAIANDPRFPPKVAATNQRSTAMPSVTGHRIWFHGRCTAPSYSCVEIVKISRGYPPLNWIAATCSLFLSLSRSRSLAPSPPLEKPRTYPLCLRFGLLPRRFSFRLVCAYVRAFFHVFFSPVFLCTVHGMSGHVDLLRKAILVISRHCWERGDRVFVFSLCCVESEFEWSRLDRVSIITVDVSTMFSVFFKSVGRFQSWLARFFRNLYTYSCRRSNGAMRMIKISYVLSFGLSERENGD